MITLDYLTFDHSGHKNLKRAPKSAFKACNGIMALVKVTLNNNLRVEDRINEAELVAGLRDALKRKIKGSISQFSINQQFISIFRRCFEGEREIGWSKFVLRPELR